MVPQRLAEEILTVWIAPFIDKDGDLHDAQRIFVTTHQARWAPDTLVQKRSASTSHWLEPLSDQPIPSRTQRP